MCTACMSAPAIDDVKAWQGLLKVWSDKSKVTLAVTMVGVLSAGLAPSFSKGTIKMLLAKEVRDRDRHTDASSTCQ